MIHSNLKIKLIEAQQFFYLKAQIYKLDLLTKKLKNKRDILDNLTVQFYGDFGTSAEIKPVCHEYLSMQPHDLENRLIDVFHFHSIRTPDLGSIFKIKLKQNFGGKPLNWYLEGVKITHDKLDFSFPYHKWIRLDKDKKKAEIKLYEKVGKTVLPKLYKEIYFYYIM